MRKPRKKEIDEIDIAIIREMVDNNMRISIVARKVYLHRNSVSNRFKKIEKITGLNPNRFRDLAKLIEIYGGENDADKTL